MSLSETDVIMGRIKSATPLSQIAVIIPPTRGTTLDAFFANTISGQKFIADNQDSLVGIFDSSMPTADMQERLYLAVDSNRLVSKAISEAQKAKAKQDRADKRAASAAANKEAVINKRAEAIKMAEELSNSKIAFSINSKT